MSSLDLPGYTGTGCTTLLATVHRTLVLPATRNGARDNPTRAPEGVSRSTRAGHVAEQLIAPTDTTVSPIPSSYSM